LGDAWREWPKRDEAAVEGDGTLEMVPAGAASGTRWAKQVDLCRVEGPIANTMHTGTRGRRAGSVAVAWWRAERGIAAKGRGKPLLRSGKEQWWALRKLRPLLWNEATIAGGGGLGR